MIDVIPLKFGPIFKRVFGKPEVFCRFTSAVLGLPIKVDRVHTEYEYPEPIGFVRNRYDLFAEDVDQRIIVEIQQAKEEDFFDRFFYYHIISLAEQVQGFKAYCFERTVYTIVVLTSIPEDRSIDFCYAHSDMDLIDERNRKIAVYPHRMVFLAPRLVNEHTPPEVKIWMEFIKDSLDGKMDDTNYGEQMFRSMMEEMRRSNISPEELSAIKDEAAWEIAKARVAAEGRAEGRAEGLAEGKAEGKAEGVVEGQMQIVRTMLERGATVEQIAQLTSIAAEDIEKIRF